MRGIKWVVAMALVAGTILAGCSYGGIALVGNDKMIITRNDGFLFGALRKIYVCNVQGNTFSNCQTMDGRP